MNNKAQNRHIRKLFKLTQYPAIKEIEAFAVDKLEYSDVQKREVGKLVPVEDKSDDEDQAAIREQYRS